MKILILINMALMLAIGVYVLSAMKENNKGVEAYFKSLHINDAFIQIKVDSILKYKVKEHNDE